MTFSSIRDSVTERDPSVTRFEGHTHQTPPLERDPVTHPLRGVTVGHDLGRIQEKAKNGQSVTRFLEGAR